MAPSLVNKYYDDAIELLKTLIAIPSFSREEDKTASAIQLFFEKKQINCQRFGNNVIVKNKHFNTALPSLLLNSHHDTVKPNSGYTLNPFEPVVADGKLFGLGSNDAGGALVSLAAVFLHFYEDGNLPMNIIYAATAEEEISGKAGIENVLNELGNIHLAIVGEPTRMQMAVAERGLLVLDCKAKGIAGHAARNEGVNAIYESLKDIQWFREFKFEKKSDWLGETNMNVTMIQAGIAHNQVPAECNFVVDVRLNEKYSHQEILDIIKKQVSSDVKERSTRIKSSHVDVNHLFVQTAVKKNITLYGSPTTSDMALMPFNSVKIGPGDSARSHSADEFIYLDEIKNGITLYNQLLLDYFSQLKTQQL